MSIVLLKVGYGVQTREKNTNWCRHMILCMMENIKNVNFKNVFLWLFCVTETLKTQNGRQI